MNQRYLIVNFFIIYGAMRTTENRDVRSPGSRRLNRFARSFFIETGKASANTFSEFFFSTFH